MLLQTLYCNDHTITEFGIIDSKNSSTAYVMLYEVTDTWFWDSNSWVGVRSHPWRWHILSIIPFTTGRGTGAETCGLDDVFPPDDLCSRPEALCYYIYIYILSSESKTQLVNQRKLNSYRICIYILYYIYAYSIWVLFPLVYQLCLALWW